MAGRPVGSAVTVALRPERLRVTASDPDDGSDDGRRLTGRVGEVTYLGNATTLVVHVEWIRLLVRLTAGDTVPAPGDEVSVAWNAESLLVLDGQSTGAESP